MTASMTEKVGATIRKYKMINKGESVLCCLSGGADSVALLLCLLELGADVKACHVNHMLRGEESLRDERFCIELCERLGVKLTVERKNAADYAAKRGLGLEEGARELRYGIFASLGCDKTATAHTLSDCLETTVFRLARGTGLDGLTGIPPVRGGVIRPLIEVERDEIEAFLRERGESFVTDSSNLSDDYSRNRIRHGAIPVLKTVNPSLERSFKATLSNLCEDARLLTELSDKLYDKASLGGGFAVKTLLDAPLPLSGRVIKRILNENDASCSRETVDRVRAVMTCGGKLEIADDLYAQASDGVFFIKKKERPYRELCICVKPDTDFDFFGKTVRLTVDRRSSYLNEAVTNFAADHDKIKGELTLRNRRGGDSIKFIGRAHTTKLKKLFQSSVPSEKRESVVLLADERGLIFAEGFGFAERVKITADTKNILTCEIT